MLLCHCFKHVITQHLDKVNVFEAALIFPTFKTKECLSKAKKGDVLCLAFYSSLYVMHVMVYLTLSYVLNLSDSGVNIICITCSLR